MNDDPFDDQVISGLRSLVEGVETPPALDTKVEHRLSRTGVPRPLIVIGSIAAAVVAIAALLVSGGGDGDHRQQVASEGGAATTTTDVGAVVPLAGEQAPTVTVPPATSVPKNAPTTIPRLVGKPSATTTTAPAPRRLTGTSYTVGDELIFGIAKGADGNLWVSASTFVARISPAGQVSRFPFRTGSTGATSDIAAGPDGNLWFTTQAEGKVRRITPSGAITEYNSPAAGYITAGPDGAMWFSAGPEGVGRITTAGVVTRFATPARAGDITGGSDGNVWFTEYPDKIGRITPGGAVTEFPIRHGPVGVTLGRDGNVWFFGNGGVGRLFPSGHIEEVDINASNSWANSIAVGPDGNTWLGSSPTSNGDTVIRIAPDLTTTSFAVGSNVGNVTAVATGPDGNLWVAGGADVRKCLPPPS